MGKKEVINKAMDSLKKSLDTIIEIRSRELRLNMWLAQNHPEVLLEFLKLQGYDAKLAEKEDK